MVKDLLDGGEDISTYEDRLRDMFGIYAYPWFTMDRLVINIVRQLQALASGDELSRRLTNLYRSWTSGTNYSTSGTVPIPHRLNHTNSAGNSGSGSFVTLPQHRYAVVFILRICWILKMYSQLYSTYCLVHA